MSYYFAKTVPLGFEEAVRHTTEMLKQQGFGIISEIDVKQTLKSKIGVDFRNYRILGACNPKLAYEALQLEDKIGTMLPCNVVWPRPATIDGDSRHRSCCFNGGRRQSASQRGGATRADPAAKGR